MTRIVRGQLELASLLGVELGPTSWMVVDQDRVNAFADCTRDHQWIHVDPKRAAIGPFGGTIAHGYLTLSLVPFFWEECLQIEEMKTSVNYGLNKVRFPAPLLVGSRIRARFTLSQITETPDYSQVAVLTTVEREGHSKPVCVAEAVVRVYF